MKSFPCGKAGAVLVVLYLFATVVPPTTYAQQSQSAAVAKPETVEWVYRVKYGFKDEWWQLFKKNQISLLERQKQLGYVKEYTVWAPGAHTSEESSWDYRIVIVRAFADAPQGQSEGEVAKQLFPDQTTYKRE